MFIIENFLQILEYNVWVSNVSKYESVFNSKFSDQITKLTSFQFKAFFCDEFWTFSEIINKTYLILDRAGPIMCVKSFSQCIHNLMIPYQFNVMLTLSLQKCA